MISILHGADLHLDSPFSSLTPEQAAERRQLQRQLPGQMVELANRLGCQLLLLAGDIFDGNRVCPETVEALRDALEAFEGSTFIVPGNHDPYGDTSLWAKTRWPERVHIFTADTEAVILPELGCRVWGMGGLLGEAPFAPAATGEYVEIGICHGEPLPPAQMAQLRLQYLALGHIHKRAELTEAGATRYAWPGAPMGRGFDECGIRGVYHVELDKERCKLQFVPIPGPRYEILTVSCEHPLEEQLPEDSGDLICRLIVTGEGEGPLPELSHRFLSLDLRDQRRLPRDLWEGAGEETLRGIALDTIRRTCSSGNEEDRKTAELAAKYLLAALEGREAP